jgi:hypothetical protein
MKHIQIFLVLLLSFSCRSQNPIIDITASEIGLADGYYVKDKNSLLNQFQGIYVYTNGNTSFKIQLIKKVQQYNGRYYEDLIIGEYQYIVNGVEKVNTLSQLNTVYNNQRLHNIDGNSIMNNNNRNWKCPQCAPNQKGLRASIKDASTDRYANIYMRRVTENGQDVMKIKIAHVTSETYRDGTQPPADFSLPLGEFTLIKQ